MDSERSWKEPLDQEEKPGDEDWKARADRLQEIVCALLAKNERMRLALSAQEAGKDRGSSPTEYGLS